MLIHVVLAALAVASAAKTAAPPEDVSAQIIALERGALDRWGKGDPGGYIEIYDPEVTYFDPGQDERIDGLDAVKAMLAPITGKIRVSRYDMLHPKVQQHGDVAVLSFNLLSYQKQPDRSEPVVARWNATAVYRRTGRTWKSIHVHWSYLKPELKAPVTEESSPPGKSTPPSPASASPRPSSVPSAAMMTRSPSPPGRECGGEPCCGDPPQPCGAWLAAQRARAGAIVVEQVPPAECTVFVDGQEWPEGRRLRAFRFVPPGLHTIECRGRAGLLFQRRLEVAIGRDTPLLWGP